MAETKSTVYEKLAEVQASLNAPKSQYNKFSNFYYRSVEDIMSSAKPLCIKHGLVLTVTDEVVMIGDRFYVKSYARVTDVTNNSVYVETAAYAREPATKTKFDESQITGAASSYARKIALGGLFALDDTKDPDTQDNTGAAQQPPVILCSQCSNPVQGNAKATAQQVADFNYQKFGRVLCARCGATAMKAAKEKANAGQA